MPTLDVYVHASKRDERGIIAHAGFVRDDLERRGKLLPGAYAMKTGKLTFGKTVEGLNGMDPYNVLQKLPELEAALDPGQKRIAYQFLVDLRLACEHCQRVRAMKRPSREQRIETSDGGTRVADLYQNDFEIVVKRDGKLIG